MIRVAYIGNFIVDYTTETYVARAFEENGCTVTRYPQQDMNAYRDAFVGNTIDHEYDLCLYTRTHNRTALTAEWTDAWRAIEKNGVTTASLHLDRFFDLDRERLIHDHDPLFTTEHVFTADGSNEERFAAAGVNHHYLPAAIDRTEAERHGNYDRALACDVLFVGSGPQYHAEYPQRGDLIRFLKDRYGSRFRHIGHGGERVIRGAQLADLYKSAAVVIGDTCFANQPRPPARYVSDRLFESIGREAFVIWPWQVGLSELYTTGRHFVTHVPGDWEDLDAQIGTYLARPGERVGIAETGRAHTIANHLWTHRARNVLATVGLSPAPLSPVGIQ